MRFLRQHILHGLKIDFPLLEIFSPRFSGRDKASDSVSIRDAERRQRRSHGDRGNDQRMIDSTLN
jgi:hypothetical protein